MPGGSDHTVPEEHAASFAAEATSIPAARQYTTHQLADWGVGGEVAILASLIVSELAANAVRHARSAFKLRLTRHEDSIRIGVSDGSIDTPIRQDPTPGSPSGYGLMIVDKISTGWGWTMGDHGKEIWASVKT